ncbi:MAG: hypothetical protein ABR535_06030 [Pyrinomonadaceae bacterium]
MRDWILEKSAVRVSPPGAVDVAGKIGDLQKAIERVIRGKSETVKFSLVALFARGHLLIEDVPGISRRRLQALLRVRLIFRFSVFNLLRIFCRRM